MRRDPIRNGSSDCEGCSSPSLRLTLLGARYLMDLTIPTGPRSRAFLTAGPTLRVQISDVRACPSSSGRECALPQFARERIDPGLLARIGWEPAGSVIRAVQLAGRISLYGRGIRPEAAPHPWLPELDLTVRFRP